ncbi:MAG: flagellar hook assembly protein FlgD [Bdellovibrionales bacterium]|jgi:flagellar basal-body rod modification protein FlgD|nr:flagellar hook assembly protein FlgD [Bdellovibrionales bacterium]MBT3527419.1 flagellar hook assembly protein FlgD [Bdellovibrionales bacterium]MBT7670471.1 flagellar hook assembly protein FlgD [Bdellovibrionales bacterium]MBT7767870.1 flagellar hook assembly protein FlgD [Bdellovibrionales bacterium]
MPAIGRPTIPSNNNYKNIKMQPRTTKQQGELDMKGKLNHLAGVREESKFVDRKKHNQMGKNEFLKLLTFQLKNQDPMNPMDQKEFAADLAQFAQLEQMTNMNQSMDKLNENVPNENKFYAASFLGKEITTKGTTLQYDGHTRQVDIPFVLPQDAKNVMMRITDSHGQMIKQIELENRPKGSHNIIWDGSSQDATQAVADTYKVEVLAWDENLTPFKGETRTKGVVTGVHFENGETVLDIDRQKKVFLRDVDSFLVSGQNSKQGVSASPTAMQPTSPSRAKQVAANYQQIKQ